MDPAALAALISGITAAVGAGTNAYMTGKTNKASRTFSREMFGRTQDANIAQWNRVNEYNSPQAQMQRYQEAGLNPNLIYGQGNSGNASSIPTPDVQGVQFRTPEWGNAISTPALAFLSTMYDLDIKQAQADNLRAQNTVITQEGLLKASQIARTDIGTERGLFDLEFEKELRGTSADFRREALRQLQTNVDISIQRNAREAALNSASVQEAFERMKNLQEQRLNYALGRAKDRAEIGRIRADADRIRESISILEKEGMLKDFDITLRKNGINPSDPMWSRIVAMGLEKAFQTKSTPFFEGLKEGIMSPFK